MLSSEDIKKLAKLAHLQINEEESKDLLNKLGKIISHVEKLKEIEVDGIEPTSHVHGSTNVFREDLVGPHLPFEALSMNVPDRSGRFIRVPLIVE